MIPGERGEIPRAPGRDIHPKGSQTPSFSLGQGAEGSAAVPDVSLCFLPRTKALVLELLAAVCLVRGGHEIILSAFDNFKEVGGAASANLGCPCFSQE